MPELPEVERARRLVHDLCVGARVTRVVRPVVDDKVFVDVDPGAFERALETRALVASERHGKQMWWRLSGDDALTPCFHLGMTGAFVARGVAGIQYYNSAATGTGEWPPRHAKVCVSFDNGVEIAYVDPRRFGKIRLVEDVGSVVGGLGADPSRGLPRGDAFAAMWRRRSAAIKTALMDQKIMAGIGNWMADGAGESRSSRSARRDELRDDATGRATDESFGAPEILYRARIHPETRANELSASQLEAMRERIIEVVTVAVEANSDHDLFPDDWLFHHRWGKTEGAKVNGDAIKFIEIGGRTTAYVPKLQLKTVKREPEVETASDAPEKKRARAKRSAKPAAAAAPRASTTRASARIAAR